jgi:hypothetical protein
MVAWLIYCEGLDMNILDLKRKSSGWMALNNLPTNGTNVNTTSQYITTYGGRNGNVATQTLNPNYKKPLTVAQKLIAAGADPTLANKVTSTSLAGPSANDPALQAAAATIPHQQGQVLDNGFGSYTWGDGPSSGGLLNQTLDNVTAPLFDSLPTVAPLAIGAMIGAGAFGPGAETSSGLLGSEGSAAGSGLAGNGALALGDATAYGEIAAAGGGAGLLAANAPVAGAASTSAGTTTAAGVAGASKLINTGNATLDSILNGAKDYAPLIGAAAGALGSGSSSTSTSAAKTPWANAMPWLNENLASGQALQQRYAANPFSENQQQAYNNQQALTQGSAQNMNSLLQQMNARQPYTRQNPIAAPQTFQFGDLNLGFGSKPFQPVQPGTYGGWAK